MNRYTQLTPSVFNPLSLEEIMMVPLARQKMHDDQQAAIAENRLFDINRMKIDDPIASERIADYRKRLGSVEDELLASGVNPGVTRKVLELKREREDALAKDGWAGKMQNNYNAYVANVDNILKNKDINPQDAQKYISAAERDYLGYEHGYNPYYGASSQNIQKRGEEMLKLMHPQEITLATGWEYNDADGTWTNGTETREKLPSEVIETAIAASLLSDPEVSQYIQALNYSTGQDHSYMIAEAAASAGALGWINNYKETKDLKIDRSDGSGSKRANTTSKVNSLVSKQHFLAERYGSFDNLMSQVNSGNDRAKRDYEIFKHTVRNSPQFQSLNALKEGIIDSSLQLSEDGQKIVSKDKLSRMILRGNGIPADGVIGNHVKITPDGKVYYLNSSDNQTIKDFKAYGDYPIESLLKVDGIGQALKEVGSINRNATRQLNDINDNSMAPLLEDAFKRASQGQSYSYDVQGLDAAKRKVFDRDMKSSLRRGGLDNFQILSVQHYKNGELQEDTEEDLFDEDTDLATSQAIMSEIGAADLNDFNVLGVEYNPVTGTPSVILDFNTKDDGDNNNYLVEVALDKVKNYDNIDSGEAIAIDFLESYGGEEGAIIAQDLRKSIKYKDVDITHQGTDFSKSNKLKENFISPEINGSLTKAYGENYQMNIYANGTGQGTKYNVKVKGADGKATDLKWGDILQPNQIDFNQEMTPDIAMKQASLLQYAFEEGIIDPSQVTEDNIDWVETQLKNILGKDKEFHIVTMRDRNQIFDLMSN